MNPEEKVYHDLAKVFLSKVEVFAKNPARAEEAVVANTLLKRAADDPILVTALAEGLENCIASLVAEVLTKAVKKPGPEYHAPGQRW